MTYRMTVAALYILIFLLTSLFARGILKGNIQRRDELKKTYYKVLRLGKEYEYLKRVARRNRGRVIKGGVLTFIEDISKKQGLSDRIDSIKPVPGKRDVVEVIYSKVTLREVVDVFSEIRAYGNLRINTFSIKKRFDSPEYAELRLQIEKI